MVSLNIVIFFFATMSLDTALRKINLSVKDEKNFFLVK